MRVWPPAAKAALRIAEAPLEQLPRWLGDEDPVAAGLLRVVHRAVGRRKQIRESAPVPTEDGDAGGEREAAECAPVPFDPQVAQPRGEARQRLFRAGAVGVRQHDAELLAAV